MYFFELKDRLYFYYNDCHEDIGKTCLNPEKNEDSDAFNSLKISRWMVK